VQHKACYLSPGRVDVCLTAYTRSVRTQLRHTAFHVYHLLKAASTYFEVVDIHIYPRLWKRMSFQKQIKFVPIETSSLTSAI